MMARAIVVLALFFAVMLLWRTGRILMEDRPRLENGPALAFRRFAIGLPILVALLLIVATGDLGATADEVSVAQIVIGVILAGYTLCGLITFAVYRIVTGFDVEDWPDPEPT